MIPKIPTDCDLPPTLYAMLNSIVNYGKDEKTKIEDLAKAGRTKIFNFEYPLSNKVNKEDFEEMILNHFIMRRLGYDQYTAWHIALKVKMNEIMPKYNKMFDMLTDWNIFNDGEEITRTTSTTNTDTTNSSNEITTSASGSNTSDRRFSDTPQNQLSDVRDGSYVTEYNYDQDNSTNSSSTQGTNESESNGNRNESENIKRTPADKLTLYKEYMNEVQSIYSLIFRELDCLFYQLV
jgi:hypothetical protein